jgi:hypothetical protein
VLTADLLKHLYQILSDDGVFQASGVANLAEIESWAKACGFTQLKIDEANHSVSGTRAKWVAAAAPLKRKKVVEPQPTNPWAALQKDGGSDVAVSALDSF